MLSTIERLLRNMIIASALLIAACTSKEPIPLLEDYEMGFLSPTDKTFTYLRLPANDTITIQFQHLRDKNYHYVREVTSAHGKGEGTRKYLVKDGRKSLVELEFQGELAGVDISILDYEMIPGTHPGSLCKYEFEMDNLTGKMTFEEFFEKDTAYVYNGATYPALKYITKFTSRAHVQYLPFMGGTKGFDAITLFAKNVGLVYYRSYDKEYPNELRLLSVQ